MPVLPDPTNPDHIRIARMSWIGWAWFCSGGEYERPKHIRALHDAIGDAMARAESAEGGSGRLLVEEPPRHGKTEALRYFAGWWMCVHRNRHVIYAAHSKQLADRFGSNVRGDIENHAGAVFGLELDKSTRAKGDWKLAAGAEFYGVGIGGAPHGRGAGLLITDDLIPNREAANSEVQLEAAREFLGTDLLSRRSRGAFLHVGIQTRWRVDDPHGFIMGRYPGLYHVLRLPAIAEDDDPLGREKGEALWPEAFPLPVLREQESGYHPNEWAALYQQRPTPEEGGIWRRAWWEKERFRIGRRHDERWVVVDDGYAIPLSSCRRLCFVDLATSEKDTADYTVILAVALTSEGPPRMALLDIDRGRMSGPDIMPATARMMERWGCTEAFFEEKGNQKWGAQFARAEGIVARTLGTAKDSDLRVPGDKVACAYEATPVAQAGRMLVPREADWLGEWETELLTFPTGKKDQADVTAWACLYAKAHGALRVTEGRAVRRHRAEKDPRPGLKDPSVGLADPARR